MSSTYDAKKQTFVITLGVMLIVLGLWGFYGPWNGFNGETGLIVPSDISPGFDGFFYVDPLRKFTSIFYHLSYLLSLWVDIPGSFIPYQIVYAILWAARGVLTFFLVKELVPNRPALAIFSALFSTMYVGDGSINWIGQLNQMGMVFWTLLSMVFFVYAQTSRSNTVGFILAATSAFFCYLALWSYESPLPVLVVFPASVAVIDQPRRGRRFALITFIFLLPIVWFLILNATRYLSILGAATYQASVIRTEWSIRAMGTDLYHHTFNAFKFWDWPHVGMLKAPPGSYLIAAIPFCAGLVAMVSVAFSAERRENRKTEFIDSRFLRFVAMFFCLLVAAYLVPILLVDNLSHWRTEYLPSFAVGSLLASFVYALVGKKKVTFWIKIPGVLLIVLVSFYSIQCGVNSGLYFHNLWERHRVVIASILRDAPSVDEGTLIILRNVDITNDPFGHNMWFDMALRAAYPGTTIAGVYFHQDGQPAPGSSITFAEGSPILSTEGHPTLFHQFPTKKIINTLVFDYSPDTSTPPRLIGRAEEIEGFKKLVQKYDPCIAVSFSPNRVGLERFGRPSDARPSICKKEPNP